MFAVDKNDLPEGKSYVSPGIHEVTVVDFVFDDSQGKDTAKLKLKRRGEGDDASTEFTMYFTEKAMNISKGQLAEIFEAANPQLLELGAETLKEYVAIVAPKFKGRSYIQKFVGRQSPRNGVFYANLPLSRRNKKNPEPTIATALNSEIPFTFDESNAYDMQAAPQNVQSSNTDNSPFGSETDAPDWTKS
jgi:hypothetical protein